MKFGKEFVSQMVPEWKEAYMDYDYLKTLLKEIQRFKQRTRPQTFPATLGRRQTLYRAFSGLTRRNYSPLSPPRPSDVENQVILVNSSSSQGGRFETMFLMAADEGGEFELVYFKRLDDEFNKVLDFYKSKVGEVMEEAAVLDKQMDALIAFRVKVESPDQEGWFFDREAEMRSLASGVAASAAALSASTPHGARGDNDHTRPVTKFPIQIITSRRASKAYLKMVEKSFLDSSDGVSKLMDRVEATFIQHFSNSNRRKGMSSLRPRVKKERHRVTFSLGFLFGCTVALLLALVLITRARDLLNHTVNFFCSLFGYITLHMLMYAANIYFWRRYRVHYPFIFGFKEGTHELGFREVLLLSCCVAVLSTAAGLANLDMEMDPKTLDYKAITELVPLGLLVVSSSRSKSTCLFIYAHF
ncbi:hypothetical protein RHGRI_034554 [Rhododendron griersonianum]|uniref:SPX domain-containing protein n=1 Tax=Rhododendron griersonianum TaxID=479676 RepID=A0AAV6I3V5_9ERIC|nr:hypothetical protein RHGRI_034554 [Rhododendron griersonianum]